MKANRQKTIPCRAGVMPSAPGMKTSTVLLDPALMMSRVEMITKMAISMVPRTTPARVLNEMPLYSSPQVNRPQATARMAHISVSSTPR